MSHTPGLQQLGASQDIKYAFFSWCVDIHMHPKKNPTHPQKSPMSPQKSPIYRSTIRHHSSRTIRVYFSKKAVDTSAKEPYISTKEPYISTKEPYISIDNKASFLTRNPCVFIPKRPYTSTKEPYISTKEPNISIDNKASFLTHHPCVFIITIFLHIHMSHTGPEIVLPGTQRALNFDNKASFITHTPYALVMKFLIHTYVTYRSCSSATRSWHRCLGFVPTTKTEENEDEHTSEHDPVCQHMSAHVSTCQHVCPNTCQQVSICPSDIVHIGMWLRMCEHTCQHMSAQVALQCKRCFIDWFFLAIVRSNLVRGLSNKQMKLQNKREFPLQLAPLWIGQPRKQNQSIAFVPVFLIHIVLCMYVWFQIRAHTCTHSNTNLSMYVDTGGDVALKSVAVCCSVLQCVAGYWRRCLGHVPLIHLCMRKFICVWKRKRESEREKESESLIVCVLRWWEKVREFMCVWGRGQKRERVYLCVSWVFMCVSWGCSSYRCASQRVYLCVRERKREFICVCCARERERESLLMCVSWVCRSYQYAYERVYLRVWERENEREGERETEREMRAHEKGKRTEFACMCFFVPHLSMWLRKFGCVSVWERERERGRDREFICMSVLRVWERKTEKKRNLLARARERARESERKGDKRERGR